VSGIESTGGHPNGISGRAFVQSGQSAGRFPHHVRHERRRPLLTVLGSADRVIPYDQAIRLDAALKKTADAG
jgi:predicted esterase